MKKHIPYIKIERNKKTHQFYYKENPIHTDRLFPELASMEPKMIFVQVYKNEKLYWEAYYPIKDVKKIEDIVWKAFRYKM